MAVMLKRVSSWPKLWEKQSAADMHVGKRRHEPRQAEYAA
jgi:hypothetical protein